MPMSKRIINDLDEMMQNVINGLSLAESRKIGSSDGKSVCIFVVPEEAYQHFVDAVSKYVGKEGVMTECEPEINPENN